MEKKEGSKFVTGFMWGALIGAGAILFLKTKTGKDLLKKLSEEGLEQLEGLSEMLAEQKEEPSQPVTKHTHPKVHMDDEPEDLHIHSEHIELEYVDPDEHKSTGHTVHKNGVTKKPSPAKRLFRGIGKKS